MQPVVLCAESCTFDGKWECGSLCVIVGPVHFGDGVKIGFRTFVGRGVEVKPNITIGSECHILENAIIDKDVPDKTVVFANGHRISK